MGKPCHRFSDTAKIRLLICSLLCDEEVMFDCIMCIRFLCVLRLSCKETECQ